jgi:hypothetical protein
MGFVLFKDSFSRYSQNGFGDATLQTQFQYRYNNTPGSGFATINSGGRNGQCISLGRGGGSFSKTLPHSAEWVTGFAYRIDGTGSGGVDVFYSLSNNFAPLCQLAQAADGTIVLYAGDGRHVIQVTDRSLITGRWYYLEVHVTLTGTTPISCTAELRINGHVEASGTASTERNASELLSLAGDANVHQFNPLVGIGGGCSFDDLYIKNEAGYEDDVRNAAIYPDGDGGTLDWTPNSGVTHFDRVNTAPVDLTKWLETATPGDMDLWTFTLPSLSGTIVGINISVLARKDDEGTKSFKIVVGTTGTDATSDEFFVSDATPEYYEFSLKLDPATGLAWVPGATITVGVVLIS